MSTSPDQIVLSPEQKQQLARLADKSGRPWAEILVEALTDLERVKYAPSSNEESVHDAMQRLGFLGCVKGAPHDLSTNPAYMKGFGTRGG